MTAAAARPLPDPDELEPAPGGLTRLELVRPPTAAERYADLLLERYGPVAHLEHERQSTWAYARRWAL